MNWRSRSSRPTGPKMRVPRGTSPLEQDGGVIVKADARAVRPPVLLVHTHDHSPHDGPSRYSAVRRRLLNASHNDVAHVRILSRRSAEHTDAHDLARTAVVGDSEPALLLNHVNYAFCESPELSSAWSSATPAPKAAWRSSSVSRVLSMTSINRQRFRRLIGRDSSICTTSPMRHVFSGSWAMNLRRMRTGFLYSRWRRIDSTSTTMVLSAPIARYATDPPVHEPLARVRPLPSG